jgi:signal transduction histidine kinase
VRVTEVHVEELFSALRGIVIHLPRSPGVTVVFDDLNGVPTLRTDAFKLSQILRNYVVNGLKFTERGEVRISAAAVDAGGRSASPSRTPARASDLRPLARVRGVRPARRRGEVGELRGSGLGLSICKRLATLLGGEVGVSSEPGRGTTFTATIPAIFVPGSEDVEVIAEG